MRKQNPGIYMIKCLKNQKIYIGSSINIERRWEGHKSLLRKNKHHSVYLQNSWNIYGAEYFYFNTIELCEKDQLIIREQFYLDKYKSYIPDFGFNMTQTAGFRSWLGKKHKKSTIEKMRQAQKGKVLSEETKKKIGAASRKRKPASEETRQKLSECVKRRKTTDKYRERLSKANRGKHSKVKQEIILAIKKDLSQPYRRGMYRQIAKKYDLDERYINSIKSGKCWSWLNS